MHRTKKYLWAILLSSISVCLLLYVVEQVLRLPYVISTPIKMACFLGLPFLVGGRGQWKRLVVQKGHFKTYGIGVILGVCAGAIIGLAFVVLNPWLDLEQITSELILKSHITPEIFIWVGLYITLGNSLLEEFFFRGFLFLNLVERGYVKTAYVFSALLFSVYHLSIFATWFSGPLVILALVALFTVGFVFNYVNVNAKTIINSWIMHLLADAAIVVIGLRLFALI